MKLPTAVGVPLIVITLADQEAVTPAGKFVYEQKPVPPVVVIVIFVKTVFTVNVGLDDAVPAVFGVHDDEDDVQDEAVQVVREEPRADGPKIPGYLRLLAETATGEKRLDPERPRPGRNRAGTRRRPNRQTESTPPPPRTGPGGRP